MLSVPTGSVRAAGVARQTQRRIHQQLRGVFHVHRAGDDCGGGSGILITSLQRVHVERAVIESQSAGRRAGAAARLAFADKNHNRRRVGN